MLQLKENVRLINVKHYPAFLFLKLCSIVLASGDDDTDFSMEDTTGKITVATGKTLDMAVTPNYALVVKAVDNGSPLNTGSTTVSITVSSGAATLIGTFYMTILALLACRHM